MHVHHNQFQLSAFSKNFPQLTDAVIIKLKRMHNGKEKKAQNQFLALLIPTLRCPFSWWTLGIGERRGPIPFFRPPFFWHECLLVLFHVGYKYIMVASGDCTVIDFRIVLFRIPSILLAANNNFTSLNFIDNW